MQLISVPLSVVMPLLDMMKKYLLEEMQFPTDARDSLFVPIPLWVTVCHCPWLGRSVDRIKLETHVKDTNVSHSDSCCSGALELFVVWSQICALHLLSLLLFFFFWQTKFPYLWACPKNMTATSQIPFLSKTHQSHLMWKSMIPATTLMIPPSPTSGTLEMEVVYL